jgi:hypothetical protein
MTKATICIPSNRPLAATIEPLWSAIDYAAATGMQVVISDNSGDPDKREYFRSAPEHVIYIPDAPAFAPDNLLSAITAVDSEFVLMLGDDDFISRKTSAEPFDFATVANDVVGVKPRIEIWSPKLGLTDVNDFTIDGDNAAARVLEYTRKMRGGNSSYYSFYRTSEIRPLFELHRKFHPTHTGNSDFAFVYALAASGKIVHDGTTTIRYNNERWDNLESSSASFEQIFAHAGLPAQAAAYMLLFHFLDSYVLILRQDSSLPLIERYKAAYAVAMVFLKRLIFRTLERPAAYRLCADLLGPLQAAVESEDPDLDLIFHIAGLIADRLKPGLKSQYDQYLRVAIG